MIAKVFVSACLLGERVRYHGGSAKIDSPILERWIAEGRVVSLCPEVAGGLGAPRPPAEIQHDVVMLKTGRDVTGAFLDGARQAVALARASGARVAVLKSKSPSCGVGRIYDGTFSGALVAGSGITAAALAREGIRVFDETELEEADAALRARVRAAHVPSSHDVEEPLSSFDMPPGRIDVAPVPLKDILPLRERYRREMNCQIVHDAIHERGWTDSYLLRLDGDVAGYGSAYGPQGQRPRDVIKEFYVLPEHRAHALLMFRRLAAAADAWRVEAQTNDLLLTLMLYDSAKEITSDTILFADAAQTSLSVAGAAFRMVTDADRARMFPHTVEPVGDWLIEAGGEIVATGGLMFHYNPPYGDIYMEVAPAARRRGYGSYLVQELKRTCRATGRIPAARTGVTNVASRKTLEKAGLLPCARILRGIMSA